MKNVLATTLAAVVVASAPGMAIADASYPTKAIRMVVGFNPGGFTDVAARLVAGELEKRLGQSVVIDNKPGAAGTIAAEMVARAVPDGYTLLMAPSGSNSFAPALYKNLRYDVIKDFTPICSVASTPMVLTVTSRLKVGNMKEFMAAAKSDELRFASSGVGSGQHLTAIQFMQAANIKMLHIPYKGSSQALTDLISGEVDLNMDSTPLMVPNIRAGKLVGIAITSKKRSPMLPDVPTMSEVGYPGSDITQWFGVVGPANLPPEITARLNKEINEILKMPKMLEVIASKGAEPLGGTQESFAALIKSETSKIQKLVDGAGIKIE